MTKISIITINHNNLAGLKRTVESVVNQTWQEFEYIIIDGGSTDGSAQYIESLSDKINHWVSEPDKGIYNAMNKGIVKATGEYLLFLNSGDLFYSDAVLMNWQCEIINYDLIYFDIELRDEKTSRIVSYPEKLSLSFFYLGTICHQSTFIKKKLFETIGLYDDTLKMVSDWKFFILALFQFNCSYIKVNTIIASYYLDGISSNPKNGKIIQKERQQVLELYFSRYLDDLILLNDLKKTVSNLKKSRKIIMLIKFGLLNKF